MNKFVAKLAALGLATVASSVGCGVGVDETSLNEPAAVAAAPRAITNGSPGALPKTVVVAYTTSDGVQLGCTGTLLASRWILTAAHCFDRVDRVTNRHIGLDTIDANLRAREGWIPAGANYAANQFPDQVIIHPSWQGQSWSSADPSQTDVALIHTRDAAPYAPVGYPGTIAPDFAGGYELTPIAPVFPDGDTVQCDGLANWFYAGARHANFVLNSANIQAAHWYRYADGGHLWEEGDSGGGCFQNVFGTQWLVSVHNSVAVDNSKSFDTLSTVFRDWVYANIPAVDRVVYHPRGGNL